jgi:DnaJ family protein C protein 28
MPDVEEQIQRAILEGKFGDLPGKGKPLRLEDNPHAEPAWRLAFHLLQSSGYSLPWIEQRNEIVQDYEAACHRLQRVWIWRSSPSAQRPLRAAVEIEWRKATDEFTAQAAQLNKRIRDFNLQAPHENFQIPLIQPQRELERLTGAPLSDRL